VGPAAAICPERALGQAPAELDGSDIARMERVLGWLFAID
jgi:hypothetical protein